MELNNDDLKCLHLRANIYAQSGDYDQALEAYNMIMDMETTDPNLYSERALIYSYTEKYEEAVSDLNQAIQLRSDISTYYNFRSLAYMDLENYDAAMSDLNKSDLYDQEDDVGQCYNTLWRGLIYQLTGQLEGAQQFWRDMIPKAQTLSDPVSRHRLLALGTTLLRDMQAARGHYQTLFDLSPDAYSLYMQRNYMQRIKRLFIDTTEIRELTEWCDIQIKQLMSRPTGS